MPSLEGAILLLTGLWSRRKKKRGTTKAKVGDCKLHLEFYQPLVAGDFGQGRSNSGVYVRNRYEVQLLDSFGVPPQTTEDCGGLCDVSTSLVNASLPPERWQTYDMEFHAGVL
jgi:3-keto-disaccharide hydrolase